MSETIKSKAAKSVLWSAVERFSVQGVQFVLTIVIARLVSPSDYGLIAMLGIFIAIAQTFIDSGFSNALIQKQQRTETDFSTVFYFNIVVGITVYLLFYLCSPYIASFYNEPELDIIAKVVGLNLIISAFSVVQRAKLTIALNFKLQALISLSSVLISGITGISLAYLGYGVWAIVFQSLINNFLNSVLLWSLAKWIPRICFSWKSFNQLFKYGSKLLMAGVLDTIYLNLYSLVIGKRFSATSLGYYNRTSTIAQFPSINISGIINRALFPILCEVQNHKEELVDTYNKTVRITACCVFPLMTILFCLSEPLIEVILGEQWMPSGKLLQILCLAYFMTPIMILMLQILNVKGRSDYSLKAEFCKKGTSLLLLLITMPFGIKVMCWGLVVYAVCDFLIMSFFLRKVLAQATIRHHIRLLSPIISICILTTIVTLSVLSFILNPVLKVWGGLMVAIICFCFFFTVFRFQEYFFVKRFIINFFNK